MLEEKIDLLTKETVALRKAVEANTAAQGATASGKPAGKPAAAADEAGDEDAPKAARGRGRPKKEEAAPEHDKDEVETTIRALSKKLGAPFARKLIKDQGADDLADLLTQPALYDKAFAAATAAMEEPEEQEEEEDEI